MGRRREGNSSARSIDIPLKIFLNRDFSFMESIVFYLKDSKKLTYHEIAASVNRDDRTIWTVYNRAARKAASPFHALGEKKRIDPLNRQKDILIPLRIFSDRNLAFMESIVFYLKDSRGMTYHEIAAAVNRDDRTIWTICSRAAKKRGERL